MLAMHVYMHGYIILPYVSTGAFDFSCQDSKRVHCSGLFYANSNKV